MARFRKLCLWLWLLTKRLYKKPTFLLILALIPLLIFGYGTVAEEDSGIMTIVLAAQDNSDPLAQKIIQDLQKSDMLFFRHCETPEKAKHLLEIGKADAAWIFEDDLEARICKFINAPLRKNSFVAVYERDSNVLTMLSREMLSGTVFAHCGPYVYLNYIRKNVPKMCEVSDEALLTHYEAVTLDGRLFEFSLMDDADMSALPKNTGYLSSPVRGLLAIVVVLCGLAGAMYAKQDEARGTFSWLSQNRRPWAELAGQVLCVTNTAIAAGIALGVFGSVGHWLRELVILVLFIPCVSAFSMLFGRLCGSLRFLCMWTPILLVVMLVVCPVLFDLNPFYELQWLFPPTYYVNAVYSDRYLLAMPVFTVVCLFVWFLLGRISCRKALQ